MDIVRRAAGCIYILNLYNNEHSINYLISNHVCFTCMIYSSRFVFILRQGRYTNMIMYSSMLLSKHSTVIQFNRPGFLTRSFLLFQPTQLISSSARCLCAYLFSTKNKMQRFYICQLFSDYSILYLRRSRDGKRFRINSKWETIYYDRSDFFIIG